MSLLSLNVRRCLLLAAFLMLSACGSDDTDDNTTANEAGSEAGNEAGSETTAGSDSSTAGTETETETNDGPWGEACVEDSDCSAPTDFCVKQPGMDEGYCTYACINNQRCLDLGAPATWTCNTLSFAGCEDVPSNWCGPQSEIEDFAGVVIECE